MDEEAIAVLQVPQLVEEWAIVELQDSELQEEAHTSGENASEKNKRPSVWKRVRHFLGLRKKKKKRSKNQSISSSDFEQFVGMRVDRWGFGLGDAGMKG